MANDSGEQIDFSKTLLGNDPIGPLSKLLWECQQIFEADVSSPLIRMFMSQNAATTAWHLADWTWMTCPQERRTELAAVVGAADDSWPAFANRVREISIDLAICRELATAGKHVAISRGELKNHTVEVEHDDETKETRVWICIDGERTPDLDIYGRALRWWIELYIHMGFSEAATLQEALNQHAMD
ncbi:hypothetical protein [Dyella sp. SG609]|uniref:hypothetical protein n=1 Tax=Dyella sp. SG609 TaxID=2587018 RepID=UPI00144591E2|nr:hypothetical protein [Dyella sp. SG609]NKJ21960.1 hypothetical protein [Dyella sp. SG609]